MNPTYELFFAGAGATALGTLVGAWLSFRFQKKLLKQQLDFQKTLHEEQLAFQVEQGKQDAEIRKEISKATLEQIHSVGQHVKYAIGFAADKVKKTE